METTRKTVALIGNGTIQTYSIIKSLLQSYSRIIAVDGGIRHCRQMEIIPSLLIGDLDSAPAQILSQMPPIPLLKHPVDKDFTDMELAVQEALVEDPAQVTLFAALGTRTDHALANIYLLTSYERLMIETEEELLFPVRGQAKISTFPGQTLSFFSLGPPAKGVSLRGVKWEVWHKIFDNGSMSISNVAVGDVVEVEVEEGCLICCLQKKLLS